MRVAGLTRGRGRRAGGFAAALVGLLVSGCGGGATAEDAAVKLLDGADTRPCSAQLRAISLRNGEQVYQAQGRVNLNGPLTGRLAEETSGAPDEDVIITATRVYRRPVSGSGAWASFDAATAEGGIPAGNLRGYARFLAVHGAKGAVGDDEGTGPTRRLTARTTPADLKAVDPVAAGNLAGVDSFANSVWIDGKGRVVRVEQEFTAPDGSAVKNALTLRDFGAPAAVLAPV